MEKCRTCAKSNSGDDNSNWIDLFNPISFPNQIQRIRIELEAWKLQIKQNDGLPQKICTDCFTKLRKIYAFRRKCQEAQLVLKDIFENLDLTSPSEIGIELESERDKVLNGPAVEGNVTEIRIEMVNNNCDELQTCIHSKTAPDEFVNCDKNDDGEEHTEENVEFADVQHVQSDLVTIETAEIISTLTEVMQSAPNEDIIYTCLTLDNDTELEKVANGLIMCDTVDTSSSDCMDIIYSAFECKYCYTAKYGLGKDFGTEEGLLEHIAQTHDSINPYDCPDCDEQFQDAPSRTVHMKDLHVQKQYQCDVCDKKYANRFNLRHHIEKYHSNIDYDCLTCGKKCPSQKSLKYHSKWHIPGSQLKCSYCDRIFISEGQLRTHEVTHKRDRDSEYCIFCGKSFFHIKTLRWHIYRNHGGEKPFKCTLCPEVFESYKEKRVHMLEKHAKNLTVKEKSQCIICKKKCANEIDLTEHMYNNHDDNNIPVVSGKRVLQTKREKQFSGVFQCDECPQRFNLKSALKRHSAVHKVEGRPHSCAKCKKRFKRIPDLNWHMKTHSKEKPNVCDICGKGFALKYVLTQHRKSHEALEKSFQCTTCGRTYLFEKSLLLHERVHTGKTFYACDLCGEKFVTHIKFLYHMRKLHEDQMNKN